MINLLDLKRKGAPTTKMVGVRIDEETKKWLDDFCSIQKISVSSLVYELIKQFKRTQHEP